MSRVIWSGSAGSRKPPTASGGPLRPARPRQWRPRRIGRKPQVSAGSPSTLGFSGETLRNAISEPLDQIRAGRLRPESIRVRLLVPDMSRPWPLPAQVDDLADSPMFRERAASIMRRHTQAVVDAVNELGELGLVIDAHAEVRLNPSVQLFKVYILNESEVFFGYYPIAEHKVALDKSPTAMWDLMGKDTPYS